MIEAHRKPEKVGFFKRLFLGKSQSPTKGKFIGFTINLSIFNYWDLYFPGNEETEPVPDGGIFFLFHSLY